MPLGTSDGEPVLRRVNGLSNCSHGSSSDFAGSPPR